MIEQIILGVVAGVVFGAYGFLTKAYDPDKGYEEYDVRHHLRTVFVYAVAGGLAGYAGEPVTLENITQTSTTSAYVIVAGEVFDKFWSRFLKGKLSR